MTAPVKRYMHISSLFEAIPALMDVYPGADQYVMARDYDRLEQECERLRETMAAARRVTASVIDDRDTLHAQVETMRDLLRNIAPHFAAPPGLGYLYQSIDAALQVKP